MEKSDMVSGLSWKVSNPRLSQPQSPHQLRCGAGGWWRAEVMLTNAPRSEQNGAYYVWMPGRYSWRGISILYWKICVSRASRDPAAMWRINILDEQRLYIISPIWMWRHDSRFITANSYGIWSRHLTSPHSQQQPRWSVKNRPKM